MINNVRGKVLADTFICHASEDKEFMARPLYEALSEAGVYAWLDESEIRFGQSLRQKIDDGLANCRSATIILSRPFFMKNWTQYELDGIVGRHVEGGILLFPVQHGITIEEIRKHSPSLAGLHLWNSTEHSVQSIAAEIARQLEVERQAATSPTIAQDDHPPGISESTTSVRAFGVIYVAPAGTAELPEGRDPELQSFAFSTEPVGWTRMVEDDEELEYIIERNKLRVRVERGGQWKGSEYQADQLVFSGEPFSVIIRREGEQQIYLPYLLSTSSGGFFLTSSSASGWRTFQIQA